MNRNLKILALMLVTLMPLLTGCFFSKGLTRQAIPPSFRSQRAAQVLESEKPAIKACTYAKPVAKRKYTFSQSGHKVGHNFKDGIKRAAASLRISLAGAETKDHIFITFEKMMVKSENGVKTNISVESRRVDLLSASDLSEVLTDIALAPGKYNHMEFAIKKAEIVDNGKTYNMTVPSRKIKFSGVFEIKDGYTTNLKIKFLHRITRFKFLGHSIYVMTPVVEFLLSLC